MWVPDRPAPGPSPFLDLGPQVTWLCPGVSRCLCSITVFIHTHSAPRAGLLPRGEAGDTHCQHLPGALILIGSKTVCHAGGSDSSQQAWEGLEPQRPPEQKTQSPVHREA